MKIENNTAEKEAVKMFEDTIFLLKEEMSSRSCTNEVHFILKKYTAYSLLLFSHLYKSAPTSVQQRIIDGINDFVKQDNEAEKSNES